MNYKRLIDDEHVSFYHVIIKIPDRTDAHSDYALDQHHKSYLVKLLFWLDDIYTLECINYCVMSTHVHFILKIEPDAEKALSLKEVAQRHQCYYKLRDAKDARCYEIREFRKRLNNMSNFVADLEKRFTRWYNSQLERKRRGSLWNPRYKSVLLGSHMALLRCLQYVELNPIRAQMVKNPAHYEFCSWSDIIKNT